MLSTQGKRGHPAHTLRPGCLSSGSGSRRCICRRGYGYLRVHRVPRRCTINNNPDRSVFSRSRGTCTQFHKAARLCYPVYTCYAARGLSGNEKRKNIASHATHTLYTSSYSVALALVLWPGGGRRNHHDAAVRWRRPRARSRPRMSRDPRARLGVVVALSLVPWRKGCAERTRPSAARGRATRSQAGVRNKKRTPRKMRGSTFLTLAADSCV